LINYSKPVLGWIYSRVFFACLASLALWVVPGVMSGVMPGVMPGVMSSAALAHEIRPAIADFAIDGDQLEMRLEMNGELFLADIDATAFADTDEAPEADLYDRLRALNETDLADRLAADFDQLADLLIWQSDTGQLVPSLVSVTIESDVPAQLPRLSSLVIRASLPPASRSVQLGWDRRLGALVLRQTNASLPADQLYTGWLEGGEISPPITLSGPQEKPRISQIMAEYLKLGFVHILPRGADHILFVLGLFFFATLWRPLIWQISLFTLAHSLTLGLAAAGLVRFPAGLTEALIAASIAWVGLENIWRPRLGPLRLWVIGGFGLLHGMGFASVLAEIGLPDDRFLIALAGFNIGVELGQLVIVGTLWLLLGFWAMHQPWYERGIRLPASLLISLAGLYWLVERSFFA